MMVLGMCSVVSAAETSGKYNDDNGSITINAAIKDHPYTIYRILQLESFSGDDADLENGNYAYKVETGWEGFVDDTDKGGKYLEKDVDGYVTWKPSADKKEFAKEALEYAKTLSTSGSYKNTQTTTTNTLKFSDLKLGYYLVDSSVGSLCFLGTTNKDVTIQEKNGVPSVEKKVKSGTTYEEKNTASIGDKVEFQTTITAQAGAQNYVLHDKMSDGLTFLESTVKVQRQVGSATPTNVDSGYTVKTDGLGESTPNVCTFHIEFNQTFCDTLQANEKIIITYSATLNENAKVGTSENTNETWLMYGENSSIKSNEDSTKTFTYKIPVFKYTKKDGTNKGLSGAIFTLSKNSNGGNPIELVKITATEDTYRVAKETEEAGITKITQVTTPENGKFTIQGLDADTYYLTETKQPAGYNKLSAPVKITIDEDGKIKVNDAAITGTDVEVENKSGSLLPSTGGRGTTLFYILGAILVVGSGVVLITKKRMK